jgi:excisionase family DNA binding protein
MAAASPNLLTAEEAAVIARCSVKTVRRAYATGALTAYRRRGSRAVLLDSQDVLEWVRGQLLQPTTPTTPPIDSSPATRPQTRKPASRLDDVARTSKHGSHLRFDLSKDALRGRRSKTDFAR